MTDVTILVAVHDAAPFLPQCLDSLLQQTLRNIQIVCIDDCSTDSSPEILRNYAARDSRIEVITLDANHGQAYARNQGLKIAKGNYVTFLDSDDWFSPDALQQAVDVFNSFPQTDCVLFSVTMWHEGDGKPTVPYSMQSFTVLSGHEAFERSLQWDIHGIYITRKSLFDRHPYDDSCRAYSDDNTTRLHYLASREVRLCDGIYYYRQHANSITHRATARRYDHIRANESMRSELLRIGAGFDVLRRYENVRWRVLIDTCFFHHCHSRELPRRDRKHGLKEIHRIWRGIDRRLLDRTLAHHFGYRPMPCWLLFRLQEWLYFTLRGLVGKNKET